MIACLFDRRRRSVTRLLVLDELPPASYRFTSVIRSLLYRYGMHQPPCYCRWFQPSCYCSWFHSTLLLLHLVSTCLLLQLVSLNLIAIAFGFHLLAIAAGVRLYCHWHAVSRLANAGVEASDKRHLYVVLATNLSLYRHRAEISYLHRFGMQFCSHIAPAYGVVLDRFGIQRFSVRFGH